MQDGVIAQKEAAIEPLLPHPLDLLEYAISADNLKLQKVINAGASGTADILLLLLVLLKLLLLALLLLLLVLLKLLLLALLLYCCC